MPTENELNAARVELEIANDNYAALANKYNMYQKTFEAYANATPEQQAKASGVMKEALANYEKLRLDMYAAEDRIQQAQNAVNALNEQVALQQAVVSRGGGGGSHGRTVDVRGDLLGYLPPSYRGGGIGDMRYGQSSNNTPETWEDIYNSGGWNEFKKGFNNAVVDDLVLPVADALGASDDTLGVLSELKMPATEREMASKYYAYGGFGKDAADAYLQYAAMKGLESIPELVGAGRGAGTTYTVANSSKGIYNTPNAWRAVNRAGSNYSPAYWGNGVRTLKATTPNLNLTPTEGVNLAKHLVNGGNYPIGSLTANNARRLTY